MRARGRHFYRCIEALKPPIYVLISCQTITGEFNPFVCKMQMHVKHSKLWYYMRFLVFSSPRVLSDEVTPIFCQKIHYVSKSIKKSLKNKLFAFFKENCVVLLKNTLFCSFVSYFLLNIETSRKLCKKMI